MREDLTFTKGWFKFNAMNNDLASLKIEEEFFRELASVGIPSEFYDFKLVSYDRAEKKEDGGSFTIKSAKVCISNISSDLFQVTAEASNPADMCFSVNDSSIFIEATNQVVGLIVSIQRDHEKQLTKM